MKVVAFGEILFDVFGEKEEIGGAPFNFAAHLSRLGADVSLITAIGDDELGKKARAELARFGISEKYVQTGLYPTGYCNVKLDDGRPQYELVENVAYDHITAPEKMPECDAFYMGTLASRSEESRESLLRLLSSNTGAEIFFDINLRQEYYSLNLIKRYLKYTTVLKLSREEIGVFGMYIYDYEELCRRIADDYPQLKVILLTLDKDGAYIFLPRSRRGFYTRKPVNRVVSTVGAGDSFSAAYMYGFLSGDSPEKCAQSAIELSDYVVTKTGAVF